MTAPIPIRNIYYLLTYAWDFVPEGGECDVAVESSPDLVNLFAVIFARGVRRLVRRGLDRSYVECTDEVSLLRGRIDFGESTKRQSQWRARMVCTFDELSADVLHNRILRATLDCLLAAKLAPENRRALHLAREWLSHIRPITLNGALFRRVQLHRNNRHYRFLLSVCELLHKTLLPSETAGITRFRNFIRDEQVMPRLFEKFVFHFARRHSQGGNVMRAKRITWNGEAETEDARALLPRMVTDVTIDWPLRKLILDCKFYREALSEHWGRYRLDSSHLYQLHAYLTNQAVIPGWEKCEGLLLYPAVAHRLDHRYVLAGHSVRVASVDLDRPWDEIEAELKLRLSIP